MDRIMEHPSAQIFKSMLNNDPNENHLDLAAIRQKLVDNQYQRLQQWFNDVEHTWQWAEQISTETQGEKLQQETYLLTAENRRLFDKEKRAIDVLSVSNWGTEVVRLRGIISKLMAKPPPKVRQYATTLVNARLAKPDIPMFTESELKAFVEATKHMNTDDDIAEITAILSEMEPEIVLGNSDVWLDVTRLSTETLHAIRTYMQHVLEQRGIPYPSKGTKST